jgi:histidyl-tRNA synthetase
MRDFLPADLLRRRYVVATIQRVYERYGFVPLETPALENLEILLGKYGEDEKLVYRVLHRGEVLERVLASGQATQAALSDQALRYDLTVPLARVVAQYGQLPKYFKRYQIQPVWRADRPGRGRFREFYQCDVDAVGSTSLLAEAEVTGAVAEALLELGFREFVVHANHRRLLRAVIRAAGIDAAAEATSLQAVDKLDKIGRDGVIAELAERGVPAAAAQRLLELVVRPAGESDAEALAAVSAALLDDEGRGAAAEVGELLELLAHGAARGRVRFSPALARGLGYYTGPIFEIKMTDVGFSLAGGGRYDELVGMFGAHPVPAVGFSIGLERILVLMEERGMYPAMSGSAEVMICWLDVPRSAVLECATALRGSGLRVEVFPESAKLGKQLAYAGSPPLQIPFAAILGASEVAAREVTLKDLASGEQVRVPWEAVAARVRSGGSGA